MKGPLAPAWTKIIASIITLLKSLKSLFVDLEGCACTCVPIVNVM